MSEISLFEYFMVRHAGVSFKKIINKNRKKVEIAISKLQNLNAELEQIIDIVYKYLSYKIKQNEKNKTNYMELRRKVIKKSIIEKVKIDNFINDTYLFKYLTEYSKKIENIKNTETYIAKLNREFNTKFLKNMFHEANKKNFKKALMISSFTLYKNLNSIANLNHKKRKDLQTGIMKYYVRAASKTSPFSYFTPVTFYKFNSNDHSYILKNHVKINVNILKYLITLINNDIEIRKLLPLKLNNTIHHYKSNLIFLNYQNNQSIIYKIKTEDIINLIINFLMIKKKATYHEIKRYIKKYYLVNDETFHQLFTKLFDVNFLILDLEISIYEDWMSQIINKLKRYKQKSSLVYGMIKLIKLFYKIEKRFPSAGVKLREKLLIDGFKQLILFCLEFDMHDKENRPKIHQIDIYRTYKFGNIQFRIENLLFEDIVGKGNEIIRENIIKNACENLNEIVEIVSKFDDEKNTLFEVIKKILKNKFNNKPTNILPLFLEYHKTCNNKKNKVNYKNYEKILNSFQIYVDNSNVNIKPKYTEKQIPKLLKYSSFNAYFQIHYDEEQDKIYIVTNGIYPGYGKMFSRFLNNPDIVDINNFRAFHHINKNTILCDNHENSYFNGNIHPMLVDLEIKNFDGNNNITKNNTIELKQLKIRLKKNKLNIIDNQNRNVFFVDLGFQIPDLYSDFFKFLNNFSPNVGYNYSPIIKAINNKYSMTNEFSKQFPRITYNNFLILQKKYWIVDKNVFNHVFNLSSNEIFIELNIWRKKYNIPSMIYVTLIYNKDSMNEYKNDAHKPFFLDFHNSILINYFIKQLNNKVLSIKFTEMLPDYTKNNDVKEILVQWKNH